MGKAGGGKPLRGWRRAGRVVLWVVVSALGVVALQVLIAYNPGFLFPHQTTQRNITVHMRTEVPAEITGIIDTAADRIAASELNDPALHHHVYIINSFRLSRMLLWRNVYFGCNLPSGLTYVVMADVEQDKAYSEKDGQRDPQFVRTLSEVIAHEITHRLMRGRLGTRGERDLPVWVREGYCEYISQGQMVDTDRALELYRRGQGADLRGYSHFFYRLMVGYMLDLREFSFDDLTNEGGVGYGVVALSTVQLLRSDECDRFLEQAKVERQKAKGEGGEG